jgi:hypothetical protein
VFLTKINPEGSIVTGALNKPLRWILGAGALALLLIALTAGPARAATYPPPAGSSFSGGLGGWKVTGSSCSVIGLPLLCTTETGYEASQGSPAGSLQSKTSYLVNALALFKGESSFESPSFTVSDSGAGAISIQRAFADSDLVKLSPQLEYTVSLVDKSVGAATKVITETVTGESDFVTKQGSAPLVAGHSYAITIAATTSSTVAELGITGSATAFFDNVSLATSSSDGGAGGGGNGGNGNNGAGGGEGGNGAGGNGAFSDSRLASLLRSSMTGKATVKGNRVFVKAKCPAKVGAACRVTVQGLLKKGKPATAPRTAKIAKGKSKQLVLKVKPKLRKVVAKRNKLLFKQTVKAAGAKATVYKRIKLIRHK